MRCSAVAWEQYASAREHLRQRIADKIRRQMSALVGEMSTADLLLVAADGKKLPAHECILRARAPGFYQRHIEATVAAMGPKQEGKIREVAIGDIDSAGLEFFIHSVYTEDEIASIPNESKEETQDDEQRESSSRLSEQSAGNPMEESVELEDFLKGEAADDDKKLAEDDEEVTPSVESIEVANKNIAGLPPSLPKDIINTVQQQQPGVSSSQSSPRRLMMSGANMRSVMQQQQQQHQPPMDYPQPPSAYPSPYPSPYPPMGVDPNFPNFYSLPAQSHHHHYAVPMVPGQSMFGPTYPMPSNQIFHHQNHPQPYYQQYMANYAKMHQYPNCMTSSVPPPSIPNMTSFRDLATNSPIGGSAYSLGGRSEVADIPEEEEIMNVAEERRRRLEAAAAAQRRRASRENIAMSKFIRFDSLQGGEHETSAPKKDVLTRKRSSGSQKQIFPMFFGLDNGNGEESPQEPRSGRGSALEQLRMNARCSSLSLSKRLSMTSLTSLTSIDVLTPSNEGQMLVTEKTPASKLAADLMQMYSNNEDTDVVIRTQNGDLHAHKCILAATCPFFRQQLQKSKRIEMKGFTKNAIHYLLCFLYGGLTTLPDDVDAWEMIALATHLNHKDLADVVMLHLKATKCHWFHRPCAACVSAVFDCLPQLQSIRVLKPLYEEVLAWQAKHFARIWKGRVFIYLSEQWQKECYEAVIEQMNDETVIETILGCERLQVALPRLKAESASQVLSLVDDIVDVAMQYLIHSFHLVVTSKSFKQQGKGLALNLGLLEELLPALTHSLSADVAIKSFIGLSNLLGEIEDDCFQQQASPKKSLTLSIQFDKWSTRFISLVKRLYELTDKHLLHYAASVVSSESWQLLDKETQARIQETGLFIEMRQAKAPPPRLSSHNRSYKRSASTGVRMTGSPYHLRAKSAERSRPLSIIEQSTTARPSSEDISKNGSSQELHNLHNRPNSSTPTQREAIEVGKSLIPAPTPKAESTTNTVSQNSVEKLVKKPTKSEKEKSSSRPSTSTASSTAPKKPEIPRPTSKSERPATVPIAEKTKTPTPEPAAVSEKATVAKSQLSTVQTVSKPAAMPTSAVAEPEKLTLKRSDSPSKLRERNVETRRKSPVKKTTKVIESDGGRLERQGTHTIMTGPKSTGLPGPETRVDQVETKPGQQQLQSSTTKPKSVVKPMVQEPNLPGAVPKIVPSTSASSTTSTRQSSLKQPTAVASNVKTQQGAMTKISSIPKATTTQGQGGRTTQSLASTQNPTKPLTSQSRLPSTTTQQKPISSAITSRQGTAVRASTTSTNSSTQNQRSSARPKKDINSIEK